MRRYTHSIVTTATTVATIATVFFSYNIIYAWTTPTATPPGGNVDAPLNVGVTDQVKSGGLSVSALTTENGLAMPFNNTAWRMVHNDGAGNFEQYIDTTGGTSPTFEADGYAWKEYYNLSDGIYRFRSSGGTSGISGNPITWSDVLKINPGGNIDANKYCDINNSNCFKASDVSSGGGVGNLAAYNMTSNQQNIEGATCSCKAGDALLSCNGGTPLTSNSYTYSYKTANPTNVKLLEACNGGSCNCATAGTSEKFCSVTIIASVENNGTWSNKTTNTAFPEGTYAYVLTYQGLNYPTGQKGGYAPVSYRDPGTGSTNYAGSGYVPPSDYSNSIWSSPWPGEQLISFVVQANASKSHYESANGGVPYDSKVSVTVGACN